MGGNWGGRGWGLCAQTFNAVISKMVGVVLWTSPVGIASLIAAAICRACSLLGTLSALVRPHAPRMLSPPLHLPAAERSYLAPAEPACRPLPRGPFMVCTT